jgi:Gti1/Pac2 family transcription factor
MGAPITNENMPWPSPPQESPRPHEQAIPEENVSSAITYKPALSRAISQPTPAHGQAHFSQSPASATNPRTLPSPITTSLGSTCMQPTWRGFIHTTRDGLLLLEACLQGHLSHIPRRPHDRERQSIISSGNIFVYEENASGIRRWTDGITWSPSRIMGNFLVYRELRDGHQPGEKKRAAKKRKRGSEDITATDASGKTEEDRQLIGSLSLDAYNFKPGGLAKKTLSVELRGVRHHIISYYRVEDVKNGMYHRPTQDEYLRNLEPRRELVENPGFKFPVEDRDDKVNIVVSPTSHLQPSHQMHRQMVGTGYPVAVNSPHHSSHMSHSVSHGVQTSSSNPHQPRATAGSYQYTGALDPFDLDTLHTVPPDHINRSTPQHTPTSPHPSTPAKSLAPSMRPIRPSSEPAGERDPKRQRPENSQMVYWDGSPHISQGVEWSFPSVPSYQNKYVEDIQYHGNFMPQDYSHQSVYMMPQQQSYSG